MNTIKSIVLAACTLLALTATQAALGAAALSSPATLRAEVARVMSEQKVPGGTYVLFDRKGQIGAAVIGVESTRSQAPVTAQTRFRAASITKTVTALAILQLVEQGHFGLDTPVASLLPDAPIRNRWAAGAPVRVAHLLSHTAGFDDTHPNAFFAAAERRGGHLQAVHQFPQPLAVRWQPGTMHSYSNPGYWVLGAILEAHYGQPWDEVVRAQVLQPLGMDASVALVAHAVKGPHARGHRGAAMLDAGLPFGVVQADGALWSTGADLARLGRFLLTDGASAPGVLGADLVRSMQRHQQTLAAAAGLDYGYGLGLQPRALNGIRWLGHTGADAGALASLQFNQAAGMGYVLMVNSENALRPLEKPIAAYIAARAGLARESGRGTPLANDVDGWYRAANPRSSLIALLGYLAGGARIEAQGDRLQVVALVPGLTMAATLNHYGKGILADVDDGGIANGAILRGADGQVTGVQVGSHVMLRSSMLAVAGPAYGLLAALALVLSAPFGRRHRLHNRWVRGLPALGALVLVLTAVCLLNLDAEAAGSISWQMALWNW